jgi:hypothetical protein
MRTVIVLFPFTQRKKKNYVLNLNDCNSDLNLFWHNSRYNVNVFEKGIKNI